MAAEPSNLTSAVALDRYPDLALPALFRAAIGPLHTERYLKVFTRLEADAGATLSWNWAASLCTFNWLLLRALLVPAAVYLSAVLLLPLLLVGVGRLVLHWSDSVEWLVVLTLAVAFFAVPGALGDRLLYRQRRQHIEHALALAPTLNDACTTLAHSAPTPQRLKFLAMANAVLLALAGVVYFSVLDRPITPPPVAEHVAQPSLASASASASAPVSAEAVSPAMPLPPPAVATPAAMAVVPASEPVATPAAPTVKATPTVGPAAPAATRPGSAPPVTSSPGHFVNVGLFADPDNARRAYVKLIKAGLPASREVIWLRQKKLTRVRVGPFASAAQARAAVSRIKALQLDAVLAKR